MASSDMKADLRSYLQGARDVLVWKLGGLPEYEARRPLTPTGTNLLGMLKHLATWEFRYFGDTFGRPPDEPPPWCRDDQAPGSEMWATAGESRELIIGWYRRAWAHSDGTLDALDLDTIGRVPWWGEYGTVTLGRMLAHMTAETQRHAGQADILRELTDGMTGFLPGSDRAAPPGGETARRARWDQVEQAAQAAQKESL